MQKANEAAYQLNAFFTGLMVLPYVLVGISVVACIIMVPLMMRKKGRYVEKNREVFNAEIIEDEPAPR